MSSHARIKVVQCGCGCQYSYSRALLPTTAACPDCGKLATRFAFLARRAKATRISGASPDGADRAAQAQMIVVTCFDCGAQHSLDMRFHGQRIKCRRCGSMFDTIRLADPTLPQD